MFSLRDLRFVLCSRYRTYVRKGSWAFYLNYPQINEVGSSDHLIMSDVHYGSRRETVLLARLDFQLHSTPVPTSQQEQSLLL